MERFIYHGLLHNIWRFNRSHRDTRYLIIFCHSLINNTLAIMTAEQDIPFALPPDTTPSQFKEYVDRARLIVGASNVTVITSDAHPDLTGATSYMSPAKAHDMYNILPKTHFLAVRFPLHHSPSSYNHPEHTRRDLTSQYEYRSWRKCREKLQLEEKQKHRLKKHKSWKNLLINHSVVRRHLPPQRPRSPIPHAPFHRPHHPPMALLRRPQRRLRRCRPARPRQRRTRSGSPHESRARHQPQGCHLPGRAWRDVCGFVCRAGT